MLKYVDDVSGDVILYKKLRNPHITSKHTVLSRKDERNLKLS